MARHNLKSARKEKGMTLQEMADLLNITLRHYQNLESGSSIGSVGVWDSLEDFLGINQRKLRECLNNIHAPADNPQTH